jgi:hypothetical protein
VEITGSKLTTCGVTPDGEIVNIDFVDDAGNPVSVRLPFDLAGALAMTLPQLLTFAVQVRSGSDTARYVFPLGRWSVEATPDYRALILNLRTEDGLETAFSASLPASRALAWALKDSAAQAAAKTAEVPEPAPAASEPSADAGHGVQVRLNA